jgi:hypothetical protein
MYYPVQDDGRDGGEEKEARDLPGLFLFERVV